MVTTVCAILSVTVGTPRTRTPFPPGFGISTARTDAGKYDPEDIRFQSLYRLSCSSCAKSTRLCRSTPAAPLLLCTFKYASQTSCFGMSKGLLASLASTIRFLPLPVDLSVMLNNPTPSLHTHYRCLSTTTGRSALLPDMRYSHSLLFTTHASSFIVPANHGTNGPGEEFSCSVREPGPRSRHLYAGHRQGSMQPPPLDLSQRICQLLVLMSLSL